MAYSKRFEYIIAKTLNFEGGFQNHASDRANYTKSGKLLGTNRGISTIAYEQYLGKEPTLKQIKEITPAKAKEIYYKLFWLPMKGDSLKSDGVAWVIFDSYIATGNLKTSRKGINEAAGSKVITENAVPFNDFTLSKINAIDSTKLIKAIIEQNKIQRLSLNKPEFINGWLARLDKLQNGALELVKNPTIIATIVSIVSVFFCLN